MRKNVKILSSIGLVLLLVFSFASLTFADTCESTPYSVERGEGKCLPPYTCMISGAGPHSYYVVPVTERYRCWEPSGKEYTDVRFHNSYEGCC